MCATSSHSNFNEGTRVRGSLRGLYGPVVAHDMKTVLFDDIPAMEAHSLARQIETGLAPSEVILVTSGCGRGLSMNIEAGIMVD